MTKIYFGTSVIDSTPENRRNAEYILNRLQRYGEVINHQGLNDAFNDTENPNLNLYERDMFWVSISDCFVGEFTVPSGSYVEYQQASMMSIPILGLHGRELLTPMITHNKNKTIVRKYSSTDELDSIIDDFFEQLTSLRQPIGKFIVLEGIDGCGKDTQASLLERYLISRDKATPVKVTRGPWIKHAREIRAMFQDSQNIMRNGEKLVQLIKENREDQLMKEIIPARNSGANVISVRYRPSTLAYQGSQGVDPQYIVEVNKDMLPADLTLILDIPEEESLRRCISDRQNLDLFDKLMPLKEKQRRFYLDTKNYFPEDNIFIIDGTRSRKEVFADIRRHVNKLFI